MTSSFEFLYPINIKSKEKDEDVRTPRQRLLDCIGQGPGDTLIQEMRWRLANS